MRLSPCRAIHTCGLRLPLDIAFCDGQGVVTATREQVAPWQFAWHRSASEVWEFRAGEIARLGIRPGDRLRVSADAEVVRSPSTVSRIPPRLLRGATSVEFQIAVVGVLVPLVLAILQVSHLVVGRHSLEYATFAAARAAALDHGSVATLRRALAAGLAPLVVPLDPVARVPSSRSDVASLALRARARATEDTLDPLFTRIDILSPTAALAHRVAEPDRDGRRLIPNDNLAARVAASPRDATAIRAANVLTVRVVWCQPLAFPLVDRMLIAAMRISVPAAEACYAANRVPIEATATVHMQSAGDPAAMGF